jgi:hypothetical protein
MVVRLMSSRRVASGTPLTGEGSLSCSTVTVWHDLTVRSWVIFSETFLTRTSPQITVTTVLRVGPSITSTVKSEALGVGTTSMEAVEETMLKADGGEVSTSFLMNLTIPTSTAAEKEVDA